MTQRSEAQKLLGRCPPRSHRESTKEDSLRLSYLRNKVVGLEPICKQQESNHVLEVTRNFLWAITMLGKATCYSFVNCLISVPTSWAWMPCGSLCPSVGFLGGVLHSVMAWNFLSSVICTIQLLVWLRVRVHLLRTHLIFRITIIMTNLLLYHHYICIIINHLQVISPYF